MLWAALIMIVALVMAGGWAFYITRRQLAVTTDAQQRRLLLLSARVSLGVGGGILFVGVVAFVLTGYDWLVLAAVWPFGLLHTGLLAWTLHRARKGNSHSGLLR